MILVASRAPAACAAVILALCGGPVHSQTADDSLIGIWSSETAFGPALRGALTVARADDRWSATLASAASRFTVSGNRVRFAFPGNRGSFRGLLAADGATIDGFWLQPSGGTVDRRDPGGSGQAFASRLVLRQTAPGVWRGSVVPLDDRFTLYLQVYRNAAGVLVGAFRNPQLNSIGGASLFRVAHDGDVVRFTAGSGEAEPEIRVDATLVRPPERLRVVWPDLGHPLELTRRTASQVPDYFPRPLGSAPYAYHVPAERGDGWVTAAAGEVGMDEAALTRLVQRLSVADPALARPALIHSLLVARHGKLVLDEYFFGFAADRVHDTRSAGKTFASVMLGSAMMQGARLTPDTPVYSVLAGKGPFANPDPRKSRITLAHLMTHTSGLACDDNDPASPGNEDTMQSQRLQPDWLKYTLDLPVAHDPGTRYAYCSANTNLVGGALASATGTWLPELFDRTIARPLQFGPYYWNLMPTAEGYLGGGAFVRPRDLLKLGQAYLDGGVWRGRRIVNASWVTESTASHAEISPATTGLAAEQFGNFYGKGFDGYAWHLNELRAGDRTYHEYDASGNGGQLLMVIPELDLTIVFTAGNYGQGGIWSRFRSEIVPREIIPAISPTGGSRPRSPAR